MQIAKDAVVTIDYTLKDPQGNVIDTSVGKQPLPYLHGAGNIIPGLENQLTGKKAGDKIVAVVQPEDGYGTHDPAQIHTVTRAAFPGVTNLEVGQQFQAKGPNGPQAFRVTSVDGDNVTVDGNHALAGMVLTFDVTVKDVRAATKEELSHKHVHGPGGHHH
jgi:FKBP-type peptidyl-prolyl cis-trans isomerase SlyD